MNELETRLRHVLGNQRYEYCHQCGKCSSGCPAASFLDFRPRRIMTMVQLGMIEELLKSEVIWSCTQCLACKERCPRDAAPYDVLEALQNLAFNFNLPVPEAYPAFINSILKNGVIQTPTRVRVWRHLPTKDTVKGDFEFRDRFSLGLPQLKKPAEIQKLAQALQEALKWKEE
jgi:heterodisulfide reductase subunit C